MINEEFLKELGLDEKVITAILEKSNENSNKLKFQELLRKAVEKLSPYDIDVVLKLLDTKELRFENGEIVNIEEKLNKFKEKYPFLFKNTEIPQIISSTKSGKAISAEEFKKMSYKERAELYKKNPKLYKTLLNA